jgi:hypothetical protein
MTYFKIKDNFHDAFKIKADLSKAIDQLQPLKRKKKQTYYKLGYDIIITFGSTEFKAQFAWKENVSLGFCLLVIF